MKIRTILGMCLVLGTLCSCQYTNISDKFEYHRLRGERLDTLQREVTLKFTRNALYLDDNDNQEKETHEVAKGTTVKVIGKRHRIGYKKEAPLFFRENYTPSVDLYVAQLPGGQRAYMEIPELAIGIPGKDGRTVTDVKDQMKSVLFLYKVDGGEWTDDPGIEYDAPQIPVYFPKRHYKAMAGDLTLDSCRHWYQKVAVIVGVPVDFLSKYSLTKFLYKDASCYLYKPIIRMKPWLAKLIQAALSYILLLALFVFLVPWLAVRTFWRIKFLPNGGVTLLATIFCYIYFIVIGLFFQVTPIGFLIYAIILAIMEYNFSTVGDTVNSNRCPKCKHIGLAYDDSKTGDWHSKQSSTTQKEEKSREIKEYDRANGIGTEHVKETVRHMGLKEYVTHSRSRLHVTYYHCPECGERITTDWTEEHSNTTSHWKE